MSQVLIEMGDKVGFQCIANARNHLIKVRTDHSTHAVRNCSTQILQDEEDEDDGIHDRPPRSGYIFAPVRDTTDHGLLLHIDITVYA